MRVHNHDTQPYDSSKRVVDESRRRILKSLAVIAGAVFFGAAASGCQSTKGSKNDKTVDDFLKADKPKW